VRPIKLTLTLTLLVLTAACENTNDPFLFGQGGGGGGAVTQAQVAGDWSFTINKTATLPCTGGSLADGTRLTAHLDVLTDGTLTSASTWQNPSSGAVSPLSGRVTLTNGATALTMNAVGTTTAGMELTGTLSPTGTFTGTLHDPKAGLTPLFSAGGCEYATAGTKA
jgi:hypothetical protein